MSFTGTKFLIFFGIFLIVYALTPKSIRRWTLLAGSIVYVAMTGWIALVFAAGFAALNYVLGELIDTAGKPETAKTTLTAGIVIDAALLFGLKVLDRFGIFSIPLGFSFYAFTSVAYLIDVYRKTTVSAGSLLNYLSFSMLFPKFMQGPIVRYEELRGTFAAAESGRFAKTGKQGVSEGIRISAKQMQQGLLRFTLGFCMKVLIADKLGLAWNANTFGSFSNIGAEYLSTGLSWYGAAAFSVQLYVDWEAYMLMATGIGRMLGFILPENFDTPYAAGSIGDYFRRWHITLTKWFKDYLYIPLGGNRKGTARTVLNILIVWLVTSLWHGLSWNFLIWGLSIGVLIVFEKLFLGKLLAKSPLRGHLYVLFIIPLTWVCFNTSIGSVSELGTYFGRLFPFSAPDAQTQTIIDASSRLFSQNFGTYWIYLLAGAAFCTPYPERLVKKSQSNPVLSWIVSAVLAVLFWWAVSECIKSGGSSSMYANF